MRACPATCGRRAYRQPPCHRQCRRAYARALLVLPRPSAGDAVRARRPCGASGGGERARGGYAVEPFVGAVVRVDALRGAARHGAEVRAAVEHVIVATPGQLCGGQHGGRRQCFAAVEHAGVAIAGQRRGGQRGGRRQCRAVAEHVLVATIGQRLGGQQQTAGVGQRGVFFEKAVEDIILVRQVGLRGEVLLVEQAHDVAIRLARKAVAVALNLHLGAAAVNLRGGAVAVEAHLVARADGDAGPGGGAGPRQEAQEEQRGLMPHDN